MNDAAPRIAAYCRISVDEQAGELNTSIENQIDIITKYVNDKFPMSVPDFYCDRDRSGYTFEQREEYQRMRRYIVAGRYDILIVKDLSRFSRRNSKGLVELEDLRDMGMRIIAVLDGIDYPKNDDWLSIQFHFLLNEMPVTDASKKVRSVIRNRQQEGEWICAVPYGYYLHPLKKNTVCIDERGAAAVREIFRLYLEGWGYKRIAGYLTEKGYPTAARLKAVQYAERGGNADPDSIENVWSHNSVANILADDFYTGTLRQRVWSRKGINKKDIRLPESENIVFEGHHDAVISHEDFLRARELHAEKKQSHSRISPKNSNPYSGMIFCADCGSPMFSVNYPDKPQAFICGKYHRRGRKGCTSHRIKRAAADQALTEYLFYAKEKLTAAIAEDGMRKSGEYAKAAAEECERLNKRADMLKDQLRQSERTRLEQLVRSPERTDIINETYDEISKELTDEIEACRRRAELLSADSEKRASMKESAKRVIDGFDKLIEKIGDGNISRQELSLIVRKIYAGNDGSLTIELCADISELIDAAAP